MRLQNAEVVRQPVAVAARSRRRLEQHVRFPNALALFSRVTWRLYARLSPRSRLRQAITRRYVQHAFEALNRGDLEAAFGAFHPDAESIWPDAVAALGLDRVNSGREAR